MLNVHHKREPKASTGISQQARSFQAPVSADYLGVLANRCWTGHGVQRKELASSGVPVVVSDQLPVTDPP